MLPIMVGPGEFHLETNRTVNSITLSASANRTPGALRQTLARMAPASLCVQVLSLGSSVVLAALLGGNTSTDAYYLALSVPVLTYVILEAALRLGAIPSLTSVFHGESDARFVEACSEVVTATLAVAGVLIVPVTGVMLVVLPALAGASAHLASTTRLFLLELAPYGVTGAALGALGAILAVRGRFALPVLVLCFEPLLKMILLLLFHGALGAQALVIGNLIGNFVAVAVLWLVVRRNGVAVRLSAFRTSPVVRAVFALSAPLLVSQSVLQLNPLIDRTTAAPLGAGKITVFELGVRLFSAPTALLSAMLIAPLAATWSARLVKDGWDAVSESFGRGAAALALVGPPLVTIGFLLRKELVTMLYGGHAYTPTQVVQTANVLGMLLLGLLPQVLVVPLATLFVIHGDSVFPMKIGIVNAIMNAALDLSLRGPLGVSGIALSTSITFTVLCAVYVMEARRRWGSLHLRMAQRPVLLSLASCSAITLGYIFVLAGVPHPYQSRIEAGVVVATALAIGCTIHALVINLGSGTPLWPKRRIVPVRKP